jgi:type IV pilus assembly protein PilM
MLFGSKRLIGLDIGTSSIKVAEIEVNRKGADLLSFGMTATPLNSINGGDISNPSAISVAVQSLLSEIKMKKRSVSIGIWGTAVIVKKITIPKIEKKLIAEQIKWEAEQYIPFDVNDIVLDYHIINPQTSGETFDILLVAAQNDLVAQYNSVVTGSGMQMSVLDVSGFALANAFELNFGKTVGETIALLNIGAGVTNFVILSDGEVIFSRDIPVGGQSFTNEIHKEMGMTLTEAEAMKISASHGSAVPEQVQSIISNSNESVAEEIRNSFDFFAASNTGVNPQRIFYTGGCSVVPGLMEAIQRSLSLSCEMFNPFGRVRAKNKSLNEAYLQQVAPFAAVAVGLAVRKAGDM